MFEDYYLNNDDDYRAFGTSYQEQSLKNERDELTLDEQYTLVSYMIIVLTNWVNAVDEETDNAILEEYNFLCRERVRIRKEMSEKI